MRANLIADTQNVPAKSAEQRMRGLCYLFLTGCWASVHGTNLRKALRLGGLHAGAHCTNREGPVYAVAVRQE